MKIPKWQMDELVEMIITCCEEDAEIDGCMNPNCEAYAFIPRTDSLCSYIRRSIEELWEE